MHMVGIKIKISIFDIPQTALVATLDTYDFIIIFPLQHNVFLGRFLSG
jgi:hypothetical protein